MITKSFARIHAANLVNAGIVPLTFEDPDDYDRLNQGDSLEISGLFDAMTSGKATLKDLTTGESFTLLCALSARSADILRAGGLLKYTKIK